MSSQRSVPSSEGRRIVICDYNALLLSVTGLLRMSNYCVFQAHDGRAAEELCGRMPAIALLVLNTYGTGIDVGDLVRRVRLASPEMQVLHIGSTIPKGLPNDVLSISEVFTPEFLLNTVSTLIERRLLPRSPGAGARDAFLPLQVSTEVHEA
jgi:response regulator RpfG family c-di-GMP phosphodiesterase